MAVKISRILHAGYVMECDHTQIAFDPIFENPFSRNCHAFPNVKFDQDKIKWQNFSAVFISHYHDDHCSLESLNLLDKNTPIYLFCVFEEMFLLIQELGFTNVNHLKLNRAVQIGEFKVTPRMALDADTDCIFQIEAKGLNILNVVDSWIDDITLNELKNEGPWDLIMWPFQTMREIEVLSPLRAVKAPEEIPIEWVEQLQILNPRYVIPSSCQFLMESWSWYNYSFFPVTYRQFERQIVKALPEVKVIKLHPSVSINLKNNSFEPAEALPWITPIGQQDVDYDYIPDIKPPPTSEIAKHLAALTTEQSEKVLEYCFLGMSGKYKALDHSELEYFNKPRIWKLSVYDNKGLNNDFYYRISDQNMELVSENKEDLAWTTEVPAYKLYQALFNGEALTSMYIRINDQYFKSEIEEQIVSADVVEDPLIRCLFNAEFGTYQKAQLRDIKNRAQNDF